MHKLLAFVKRDLLIALSYRLRTALSLGGRYSRAIGPDGRATVPEVARKPIESVAGLQLESGLWIRISQMSRASADAYPLWVREDGGIPGRKHQGGGGRQKQTEKGKHRG